MKRLAGLDVEGSASPLAWRRAAMTLSMSSRSAASAAAPASSASPTTS